MVFNQKSSTVYALINVVNTISTKHGFPITPSNTCLNRILEKLL